MNQVSNRIAVVGDFCPCGEILESSRWAKECDSFLILKRLFDTSVNVIGNLECPITDQTSGKVYKWANLRAATSLSTSLIGLTAVAIGNNHIEDFGLAGVRDTLATLQSLNIVSAGFGGNIAEASKASLVQCGQCTVALLSLCCPTTNGENLATHERHGVGPLSFASLDAGIKRVKGQCDAVLVYLHWGPEWVHQPHADQLRLARHAIDCGADAVVGCHSHTIQTFEQYQGRCRAIAR